MSAVTSRFRFFALLFPIAIGMLFPLTLAAQKKKNPAPKKDTVAKQLKYMGNWPSDDPHYSYISFYTDQKGQVDSIWKRYYYNNTVSDSGAYHHGKKTGLWVAWNINGKVSSRTWYNGNELMPERIVSYYENGFTADSSWRRKDQYGSYWFIKRYDFEGYLSETQEAYFEPRGNTVARHFLHAPGMQNDCTIVSEYYDHTHLDSTFDKRGWLRAVKNGENTTSFFPNGKKNVYHSHDTDATWFDNGQLAAMNVNLRNRSITRVADGLSIQPSGVSRTWSTDGMLLNEQYDYRHWLPPLSGIRLCDEYGRLHGEGRTDEKGFKDGYWHYYAWKDSNNTYCSEEGAYAHGTRTGTWKSWHANGKLRSTAQYKIFREKVLAENLYASTLPRGECDAFVTEKKKGDAIIVRSSVLCGTYVSYYPDGNVRANLQLGEKGEFNGEWKLFDSTGRLIARRAYKNDQLSDSLFWTDRNGQLVEVQYYDSLGALKRSRRSTAYSTITVTPKTPVQRIKTLCLTNEQPADPFTRFSNTLDGLGKGYSPGMSIRETKRYRKMVQKMKNPRRHLWWWLHL